MNISLLNIIYNLYKILLYRHLLYIRRSFTNFTKIMFIAQLVLKSLIKYAKEFLKISFLSISSTP